MNLQEALDKLFSLHQFGIKLGLDKITHLLDYLGNPHKNLKCFHVAGSNAKGSVASFINSILIEEGYKVGLYTSPHFVRFNERVRINGKEIEDEYILGFINELSEYIDKYEPTFFELTTAMAFKYFNENNVDYAVIETGLGGRLDATNTINPLASVITTISLEHTNILGDKIEQIAYEKGEIIKPGSKAFIGLVPDEAKKVLMGKCRRVQSELFLLEDYLFLSKNIAQLNYKENTYHIYKTPLRGEHQLVNCALSVFTLLNTIEIKDSKNIFKGINNVIKNSDIQGRYEVVNEFPKIIFDSSHNADGLKTFIKEFSKEEGEYSKRSVIFGVMRDKNIAEMLKLFDKHFDYIYATTFDYERAATIEEIETISNSVGIKVNSLKNPSDFIKNFKKKDKNECLVVLGSIYLLGYLKSKLE